MAPRYVLRRVLDLYEGHGWEPVVAPELEFFLVDPNIDSDYPLKPPVGRSGRPETGRQAYSIAAVNEFDPLFDDMYSFCDAQDIEIDTLIHESGAAQMEINLLHGYPMSLADQAFLFKRTAREAALRHKMYATFMAKPMAKEPGSAMHLHQSIVDTKTRKNIFSNADGSPSSLFFSHIAGLQKYLPGAMSLFAPNVNSYRRISRYSSAPINVHWGYDNRTAGLRVPMSGPEARRVENRVGGADANPYLAIAASLACGYLGMIEGLKARSPSPAAPTISPSRCRGPWPNRCGCCANRSPWSISLAIVSCWPTRRSRKPSTKRSHRSSVPGSASTCCSTFDESGSVPEPRAAI